MKYSVLLRKVMTVIMCAIMVFIMSACHRQTVIEADPSEIVITVDISELEETVYRLDLIYFLQDELMGGQAVSYVDESALEGVLTFRLTSEEFPEGSSMEGFKFYVVVSGDKNGVSELFSSAEIINHSNDSDVFEPQYGSIYAYILKGNYQDGFTIERNTAQ